MGIKPLAVIRAESIFRASLGVVGIARVLGEMDEDDNPVISNPTTRGNLLYGLEELGILIGKQAEELAPEA